MSNTLLVQGIFCDLDKAFVLIMISYYLKWNFMELVPRILYYINLILITDIIEQQYIMTARTVIKFQIGLK
jgi:hypothetical protein